MSTGTPSSARFVAKADKYSNVVQMPEGLEVGNI